MKHERTQEFELVFWGWTESCIMINGNMVIWGKTTEITRPKFHVYNTRGKKLKTIEPFCQHITVRILPLMIKNTEYLAMSCAECKDINLHRMDLGVTINAFSSCFPGPMCLGSLYSVHCVKGFPVVKIDCKNIPFKMGKKIETDMEGILDICYIPTSDTLLISSKKVIRAISCKSENTVWEFAISKVDENRHLQGLVYSHRHDVVLVCQTSSAGLLVLEPSNGKCILTIDLGEHVLGVPWEPDIYQGQLVILHGGVDSRPALSYFSVSIIQWNLTFTPLTSVSCDKKSYCIVKSPGINDQYLNVCAPSHSSLPPPPPIMTRNFGTNVAEIFEIHMYFESTCHKQLKSPQAKGGRK